MTSDLTPTPRRMYPERSARHAVSFVLPAHNEEANIERAVDATVAAGQSHCSAFEVIVVDDGSSDHTATLVRERAARHPEVRLVQHEVNRGYGQALRSGFAAARLDWVFSTDADNQFDMNELPLLLAWADQADVVAGFRRVRQDPFMRRANAWAWNRLVRSLFCVPIRDVDCAFKLYSREALTAIEIESGGAMMSTEIMVKLARRGAAIVEVGVTHLPRTAGTPSGAHPRVIIRALRDMARMYPELIRLDPGTPVARPEPIRHPAASQPGFDQQEAAV